MLALWVIALCGIARMRSDVAVIPVQSLREPSEPNLVTLKMEAAPHSDTTEHDYYGVIK